MGLMYIFPVEEQPSGVQDDRVEITSSETKTLILKTYGLPMVFWGYLAAVLIVVATMWLAAKSAIEKLIVYQDPSLVFLGYLVKYTLLLSPIIMLGFFFWEKQIRKSGNKLTIVFKIFFIPIYRKNFLLDAVDALSVDHFMDSPNVAKIHNKAELKQFENRGYFELHAISNGKSYLIDRHGRKADLLKMKDLLSRY